MCDTEKFNDYMLWWPRWNNQTSFDGFVEFGGWKKPFMKQFINDKYICGIETDLDWEPD